METKKIMVGAYVASASLRQWNVADETMFFRHLRSRSYVRGLEHAFYGTLHRYDDHWFLKNMDPMWDFVFITLPGVMETLKTSPAFGLASNEAAERNRALEFIATARESVQKLNHFLKRKSVLAVQIHSAPAQNSSKESFAESLMAICAWDWDGAQILVEHCDAFRTDGNHAKGFLSLEDEIWAIQKVAASSPATPVAAMLNWGRSVVEGRNPKHILQHIQRLKREKLLKGFIFSGTTPEFSDKHTPPPTSVGGKIFFENSLMTATEIQKTIQILPDDLIYLGFKIMPDPIPKDSRESLTYLDQMATLLQE